MANNLKQAIEKEYNGYMATAKKRIRNGNGYDKDNGLQEYLTPGKWGKYSAGEMTRAKAVESAIARMEKQYHKRMTKELENIDAMMATKAPNFISIRVEWHKSPIWGYNPVAEVVTGIYTTGKASGCGYDKESAAVASALNDQPGIMGELYRMKDKHPRTTNHKLFGYGSGYGEKPYFEGGVGMNSICHVIESLGYVKTSEHHGKRSDFYDFERKAK